MKSAEEKGLELYEIVTNGFKGYCLEDLIDFIKEDRKEVRHKCAESCLSLDMSDGVVQAFHNAVINTNTD